MTISSLGVVDFFAEIYSILHLFLFYHWWSMLTSDAGCKIRWSSDLVRSLDLIRKKKKENMRGVFFEEEDQGLRKKEEYGRSFLKKKTKVILMSHIFFEKK